MRQRWLDWAGSLTVMAGVAALALVLLGQLWLWPVAGVLVVAGVVVWLRGGLHSSSIRGRIERPDADD